MLLSTVLSGFVVRTLTLFRFAGAVLHGFTRRAAWLSTLSPVLSRSSAYRLWQRLYEAQSALRARLCGETPPPACNAREPLAQLFAHLAAIVGTSEIDPLEAYQRHLQRGVFAR